MASLLSALASAVAPALAPLDWAEAALVSRGITTLKPRLAALFALVYTLPAWAAALATARLRRRLPPGKDRTAIEFVRLVNRAIASTTMYFVPAYICLKGLAVWSPWAGGVWNTPLSPTQLALLHMQSMYYVMDMPYTVAKGDTEQVVHHVIGLGLAIPSCLVGGCGLPMCATLFTEQARGSARGAGVISPSHPFLSGTGRRATTSAQPPVAPLPKNAICADRAPASGCGTPSCSATSCPRTTRCVQRK